MFNCIFFFINFLILLILYFLVFSVFYKLYAGSFQDTTKIIFNLLDFDKDGIIKKRRRKNYFELFTFK